MYSVRKQEDGHEVSCSTWIFEIPGVPDDVARPCVEEALKSILNNHTPYVTVENDLTILVELSLGSDAYEGPRFSIGLKEMLMDWAGDDCDEDQSIDAKKAAFKALTKEIENILDSARP